MADNNLTPKEEFLLNPVEEHNIEDVPIASFETNLKHGVRVTVPITPTQDLHGYDHPWPAGGSVNLIPDGTDTSNGYVEKSKLDSDGSIISNDNYCYVSEYFEVEQGITYTQTGKNIGISASGRYFCFYDENKEFISSIETTLAANTFTSPSNAKWCRSTQGYTSFLIQIEKGSTASTIVPYSNICPIEGKTGIKITQTGRNLFNKNASDNYGYYNNTTGVYTKNTAFRHWRIPVKQGDVIRVRASGQGVGCYFKNGRWAQKLTNTQTINVPANVDEATSNFYDQSSAVVTINNTNTSYEDFHGATIPISWKHADGTYDFTPIQDGKGDPSPDNVRPITPGLTITRDDNTTLEVYGGSITIDDNGTSTVVADQFAYVLNSIDQIYSYPWHDGVSGTKMMLCKALPRGQQDYAVGGAAKLFISDSRIFLNNVNAGQRADQFSCYRAAGYGFSVGFDPQISGETKTELGAYLSEHPITFVYPVQYPVTYSLSVTETNRVIDALGDKVTTTVYGGTVTLNEDGSADLINEYGIKAISDLKYYTIRENNPTTGWNLFQLFLESNEISSTKGNSTGNTVPLLWSTKFNRVSGNYRLNNAGYNMVKSNVYMYFNAPADLYPDKNSFLTAFGDVPVVYPLATPKTYHFPNVGQLKAFLGQNNIWSDIGNVNVKYLTQRSETGVEWRRDRALELQRRVMIANRPMLHTAVGSSETDGLASFKSYMTAPVKSVTVPFYPKQDLHGYDHPWPAGGGKNLFNISDLEDGSINAYDQKVASDAAVRTADYVPVLAETQYTFSASAPLTSILIKFYNSEKAQLSETSWHNLPYTVTTPENTAYIRFIFVGSTSPIVPADVSWVQMELGSTATAYETYENICPIEGHDGCNVKSGWDLELYKNDMTINKNTYVNSNGALAGNNYHDTTSLIPIIGGLEYECGNSTNDNNGGATLTVACYDQNGVFFDRVSTAIHAKTAWKDSVYIPANAKTVRLVLVKNTGTNAAFSTLYMRSKTPTASLTFNQSGTHDFFPIQEGTGYSSPENIRPIHHGLTFTRDDDSVLSIYGGTLTVNDDGTGSLASTWQKIILDGSQTPAYPWVQVDAMAGALFGSSIGAGRSQNAIRNAQYSMCDSLKFSGIIGNGEKGTWKYGFYSASTYGLEITVDKTICGTTKDELKAYLANRPITVVYELAEPVTYTLSVTETNRALEALGLTQHVGTLYGGTVTINPDGSADVVKSFGVITLNGTQTISYFPWTQSGNVVSALFQKSAMPQNADTQATYDASRSRCDRLKFTSDIANRGRKIGDYGFYSVANSYGPAIVLDSNIVGTTRAELNAWLASNPITITYKLQSPVSYHFDNVGQLKVWLGENNFWCDISDDITVKYWNRG